MTTLWDSGLTTWDDRQTSWDGEPIEESVDTYPCFYPCAAPGQGCGGTDIGGCWTLAPRLWIAGYEEYPCQGILCLPDAPPDVPGEPTGEETYPCFYPCAAPGGGC